jgi:undecaprenyl-diphosphatase
MDFLQAFLLGLVEGITEYLPVSSTGHLLIAQRLMGIAEDEAANGYAIAIQSGAILAVLGLYRQRVGSLLQGLAGRDAGGRHLAICVVLAFLPAALTGFLADAWIEAQLFGVVPIILAWVAGAVLILALSGWIERRREGRDLLQLDYRGALLIGLLQCVAMWPGTSRSLVTILAGLLVGLSMAAAVEFAFLLGLLTLTAATVYKAVQSGTGMIDAYGWPVLLTGLFSAWLSATLAVKWMVAWLNRHGLSLFAWWRFAAALLAAALLLHA